MGLFLGRVRFASAGALGRYIGDVEIDGEIPLPGGTPGGVVFVNSLGNLDDDPTVFFWDETNNRLGIGNNAPTVPLDVTGASRFSGQANFNGNVVLGDATTDLLTITASLASDIRFQSAGVPRLIEPFINATLAGAGLPLTIRAGQGAVSNGVSAAGPGGAFLAQGGSGGNGAAGIASGVGGDAQLTGGSAGPANGGPGGNSGGVVINAGTPSGAGIEGTIAIGPARGGVQIGRAGMSSQIMGDLLVIGNTVLGSGGGDTVDFSADILNASLGLTKETAHLIEVRGSTTIGLVGGALSVAAAKGGPANAATPGGLGGITQIFGGFGGEGSAAQPAGAGEAARIKGGTAGGNNGGGGANGGPVQIEGGTPTGAGVSGSILVGATDTTDVQLGNSAAPVRVMSTYLELDELAGDPAAPAAGKARVYLKNSGGDTRLFYITDTAVYGPL